MSNVIDLIKIRNCKKNVVKKVSIDVAASYTCLEKCLNFIEMNNLSELRDVKAMMRRTMKILADKK